MNKLIIILTLFYINSAFSAAIFCYYPSGESCGGKPPCSLGCIAGAPPIYNNDPAPIIDSFKRLTLNTFTGYKYYGPFSRNIAPWAFEKYEEVSLVSLNPRQELLHIYHDGETVIYKIKFGIHCDVTFKYDANLEASTKKNLNSKETHIECLNQPEVSPDYINHVLLLE